MCITGVTSEKLHNLRRKCKRQGAKWIEVSKQIKIKDNGTISGINQVFYHYYKTKMNIEKNNKILFDSYPSGFHCNIKRQEILLSELSFSPRKDFIYSIVKAFVPVDSVIAVGDFDLVTKKFTFVKPRKGKIIIIDPSYKKSLHNDIDNKKFFKKYLSKIKQLIHRKKPDSDEIVNNIKSILKRKTGHFKNRFMIMFANISYILIKNNHDDILLNIILSLSTEIKWRLILGINSINRSSDKFKLFNKFHFQMLDNSKEYKTEVYDLLCTNQEEFRKKWA